MQDLIRFTGPRFPNIALESGSAGQAHLTRLFRYRTGTNLAPVGVPAGSIPQAIRVLGSGRPLQKVLVIKIRDVPDG
jgi:hypothetical protein